jgi:hypothetical protein
MGIEFPQDLTDDEASLGYQLQEIDYPLGHTSAAPAKARAVVYQATDAAERVLKVRDAATGRVEYRRQVHGLHNPPAQGETPGWNMCGGHSDPAAVLSPAVRRADLEAQRPAIVSSPPPIERQHGAD